MYLPGYMWAASGDGVKVGTMTSSFVKGGYADTGSIAGGGGSDSIVEGVKLPDIECETTGKSVK